MDTHQCKNTAVDTLYGNTVVDTHRCGERLWKCISVGTQLWTTSVWEHNKTHRSLWKHSLGYILMQWHIEAHSARDGGVGGMGKGGGVGWRGNY